jgi:hypothetical protein
MSVTSGVTKSEALPHLERLGGHRVAGLRAKCSPISLRWAGWPPVLCGYRALAPRRSSFERSLNEVGELRVLLAALIDDLVEEVRSASHCGDGSGWHRVYELAYRNDLICD